MHSLDNLTDKIEQIDPDNNKLSLLQYETGRVNGALVQLLALYKTEQNQLPLNINHHNVYDFIEKQILSYDQLLASKKIKVIINVDEELEWAFDDDLLSIVVANVISNSIRYSHHQIKLDAGIVSDMLELNISDDGRGYPKKMLDQQNEILLGINQNTGSTGLGLYFAGQVASMHTQGKLSGQIYLSNKEEMGGKFTIRIP